MIVERSELGKSLILHWQIIDDLMAMGIVLEDGGADGTTWKKAG
ncbi:MAG: hypothetical protein R8K54_07545 [Mariprofundaceae bacterium]